MSSTTNVQPPWPPVDPSRATVADVYRLLIRIYEHMVRAAGPLERRDGEEVR